MKNMLIQQRNPLGEISQRVYENQNTRNYQNQIIPQKPFDSKAKLNQCQRKRITELKNKYQTSNQTCSRNQIKPSLKQISVDSSFQKIEVPLSKNLKEKQNIQTTQSIKSNSSFKSSLSFNFSEVSYRCENFQKKVEQSDLRIASRIQEVQKKMQILRQFQTESKRNQVNFTKQSKNSPNLSKFNSKISVQDNSASSKAQLLQVRQQKQQNLRDQEQQREKSQTLKQQSSYAKQLKNINFMDQMKRKIEEIQSQRKSNIQKKLSEISSTSKTSLSNILNEESHQNFAVPNQQNKITLKSLVPNLSQSEVIELTQRQRPKNRLISEDSTVVDKYDFVPKSETQLANKQSYFNDEITEVNENEERSPYSSKSPYHEVSLQETQLIERKSLKGNFSNIQQPLSKQFSLLINRLAHQAQIDNKFACQLFNYNNILLNSQQSLKLTLVSMIREHCQENGLLFDESMFEVSQMEIDPLLSTEKVYKNLQNEEIKKLAYNLKRSSDKINSYFETKISGCFQPKTVQFFISELQKCHSLQKDEPFNMGHLTSYINMRTGKDLRNRCFYRIMKRILKNQKSHSSTFRQEDLVEAFTNKMSKP